jgi:hypothetical protein
MSDESHDSITEMLIKAASEHFINTTINGKPCTINVFFSLYRLERFLKLFDQQKGYRAAFSEISYEMFIKTKVNDTQSEGLLSLDDFLAATDDELIQILDAILVEDSAVKAEYDELKETDPFKRFYIAHKNIMDRSASHIESMFKFQRLAYKQAIAPGLIKVTEHMRKLTPATQFLKLDSGIARILADRERLSYIIRPPVLIESQKLIQSMALKPAFENIARITSAIDSSGITNAIQSVTKHSLINMSSALQTFINQIPKVAFDLAGFIQPLVETAKLINEPMRDSIRRSLSVLDNALSNIDFTLLTRNAEWDKRHDALLAYGWFYLNELPEELIEYIWQNKDVLNENEVNSKITEFFRKNKCAALKCITKKWNGSRYFQPRKIVFHEALVNHSRRCFNSSTTMLTLHTEGVISDFVRLSLKSPKYKTKKALPEIHSFMDNLPYSTLTFSDWQIFEVIITHIQAAITEGFDFANPDNASNESRDKIAHGHAVEKENEVSSLKRFLYLNELYRLFDALDNVMALAEN